MATPSSITMESAGSEFKWVVKFASLVNNDTWTSGIKGAQEWVGQVTTSGQTQASAGFNVSYVSSTGVFTFQPGLDSQACTLMVWR